MEGDSTIYEFPSTSGVLVYRVRQQGADYVCDCPDYNAEKLCRHVRAVLRRLGIHAGLAFEDERSPVVYELQVHTDGTLTCNCREWCFKKTGKERFCRHTKSVDPLTEEILRNLLPPDRVCRLTGATAIRFRKQPYSWAIAPGADGATRTEVGRRGLRRMVVWEEDEG